jgi:peroxiredoxin
MAKESRMLALGTKAPEFRLPDSATGRINSLEDFAAAPALLVAFLCNHCPYVKHVLDGFVGFAREYAPKGLATVAISSNDVESHPQDGPTQMAQLSRSRQFTFPYLYDESQSVARAYEAACTPDFFLFDRERKLVYRGQFDASRPGNKAPVSGADLRAAVDALLAGKSVSAAQIASIGCGIKWKQGAAPDWA